MADDFAFAEVAEAAERLVGEGFLVFQKFTCGGCGARQTMDEPNRFFTSGRCEECGHVTDIVAKGCNYLVIGRLRSC